jgi:NAD(P)-dependent dehydrogenase (short-subunit alcohol dehydrogenase family)
MTVLVIGAKGTIGQTCAKVISAKHAVIASDISLPNLPGTDSLALDVTKADSVREAILRIDETTPLSGLVYAAGLNTTGFVDSIDWNDYERVMAVNLRGAFNVGSVLRELLRMRPRSLEKGEARSTAHPSLA